MRKYTIPQPMTVEYFLGDHLGSTSLTTDSNGAKVSEMRYTAWGEVRYSWTSGQGTTPAYSLPDYTYTGQFSNIDDFGLLFYNARMYDPYITQFSQPDSIVPDQYNPQDWNRYAYARYNPVRYTDPSGHSVDCGLGDPYCQVGKYTAGGLIQLYRHYYGADIDMRNSEARNKLSLEIEDFMNNNPEYYPQKDIYLGAKKDYESRNVFSQIREDYWMHRLVEETGRWDPGEYGRLMAYYDFHQDVTTTEWDASRVNWVSTGLDGGSFVVGVAALVVAPEYAIWANLGSQTLGGASGLYSFAQGDNTGGLLSVGGFAKPPYGNLFSGISVIRDFSAGYYSVPYVPSIPR